MQDVESRLDATTWHAGRRRGPVAVSWGHPAGSLEIGYRTTLEVPAPMDRVAAFLGRGLLDAFQALNPHFSFGEELSVSSADGIRVVRTGFVLPRPLAPREFVHGVVEGATSDGQYVIAYVPWSEPSLDVRAAGWVRCRMEPSGQRLRALGPSLTRVEHLMTYALGGRIGVAVQNRFFHRGHLGVYIDEWTRLVDHFGCSDLRPSEASTEAIA